MSTHDTMGRNSFTGRTPSHPYCLRFLLVLALGALLLGTGCVRSSKQGGAAASGVPRITSNQKNQDNITEIALSNVGVPYKYGGNSPTTGFDCSGLVCWSYEQVGVKLPRSAREQIMFGLKVDKNELQPGDIVVFDRARGRGGYHSGIYVGDGQFVHSPSTGKTVTRESLSTTYYATRYVGARRIPLDGSAEAMLADFYAKAKENAAANSKGKGKGKNKKSRNDDTLVASASSSSRQSSKTAKSGGKTQKASGSNSKSDSKPDAKLGGKSKDKSASQLASKSAAKPEKSSKTAKTGTKTDSAASGTTKAVAKTDKPKPAKPKGKKS